MAGLVVTEPTPLVSIGLPVYNGDTYLESAIASLLDQTYENIELIICDNASTDGTRALCERAASQDPRVRYHRNDVNIGGARNHNLTFELARGKYFRWAAYDDIAEPGLIARCVEALESNPEAVVCHTAFVHIDERGEVVRSITRNHCDGARPSQRFAGMAGARDFCEESYGVIRSEIFRRTRLQQDYTGSDRTLMSELALYGPFLLVDECLFRKRIHPANEYIDWRTRMAWFGDRYRGRIILPRWIQLADYFAVIRRVPLASAERARCYCYMTKWIVVYSRKLLKEVLVAGVQLTRSHESRLRRFTTTENWG